MATEKTPEEILTRAKGFVDVVEGMVSKSLFVLGIFFYTAMVVLSDNGATQWTVSSAILGLAVVCAAYISGEKKADAAQRSAAPQAATVAREIAKERLDAANGVGA